MNEDDKNKVSKANIVLVFVVAADVVVILRGIRKVEKHYKKRKKKKKTTRSRLYVNFVTIMMGFHKHKNSDNFDLVAIDVLPHEII